MDNGDVFDMMCARAGEGGRDSKLFGGCIPRVREVFRPFVVGDRFPSIFLECPLAGEPYLDMTVLYGDLPEEIALDSKYAKGCDELFRRYSRMRREHPEVSFGFELDTSKEDPREAAIHFEPRDNIGLVRPFCEAIGEEEYGHLYVKTADKLSDIMPLSYFGMFRGRPGAPLRVCGYISKRRIDRIISDNGGLLSLFAAVGFKAYDDRMVDEIVNILKLSPLEADYQFDIYPAGKAGDIFSIDIRLAEQAAESVKESFDNGSSAKIMSHFTKLGIADNRTGMLAEMATSFAFPMIDKNKEITGYAMVISPTWLKIRWNGAHLCNAKCYSIMRAGRISGHLS